MKGNLADPLRISWQKRELEQERLKTSPKKGPASAVTNIKTDFELEKDFLLFLQKLGQVCCFYLKIGENIL